MNANKIARAADIGFGFCKLSQSMLEDDYSMAALSFPSLPTMVAGQSDIADGVMHKLNVVTVEVNGVRYLVGPDSMLAASGRATRTITDGFFTSPQYMALYLGTLAYMKLPAGGDTIHCLGMGLPLTVWTDKELRKSIKEKMTGTFTVPIPDSSKTRSITVERVELVPQVIGALISMSAQAGDLEKVATQSNLVVDCGYGTLLWLTTQGLKPQTDRSDGNNGGVSSMLKAVAKMLDPKMKNNARVLDMIDHSLRTGEPLMIDGKEVDLEVCRTVAEQHAMTFVHGMLESVGDLRDITNIFLAGGGSHLYAPLLKRELKGRDIRIQTEDPQFANVKGYQTHAQRALAR